MGVILQVALPSRVLAAARLQCGAAGAGASRGLGVCAEHARLAARGESARAVSAPWKSAIFSCGWVPWPTRSVRRLEYTDNPRTTAVDRRSTPYARADRQAPLPMFRCPGSPGFPDHLIT